MIIWRAFALTSQWKNRLCLPKKLRFVITYAKEVMFDQLINKFNARESGYELERTFTKFVEITQCNGQYAVQGHSRSPILVPIESSYTTSYDVCVLIGVSFYIYLPNFVEIRWWAAELWRHIEFSRWRTYSRKSIPGFRFGDGICLRSWKSISLPNFDQIFQSTAEIKLLPVSENRWPPYWNSIFPSLSPSGHWRMYLPAPLIQ